jgi:hypothetical protein
MMAKARSIRLRPGEAARLLGVPWPASGVVGGGVTSGDALRWPEIDDYNRLPPEPDRTERAEVQRPALPPSGMCSHCERTRADCCKEFLMGIEEALRDELEEAAAMGARVEWTYKDLWERIEELEQRLKDRRRKRSGWSAAEVETRSRALEQENGWKSTNGRGFKDDERAWRYLIHKSGDDF